MAVRRSTEELNLAIAAEDMICTICSEGVRQDRVETPCKHIFHKACLSRWIDTNPSCPSCREPVTMSDLQNSPGAADMTASPASVSFRARGGAIPRNRPMTRSTTHAMRTTGPNLNRPNVYHSPRQDNRLTATAPMPNTNLDDSRVRNMIQESLSGFRDQITAQIGSELSTLLEHLNVGENRYRQSTQEIPRWPQEMPLLQEEQPNRPYRDREPLPLTSNLQANKISSMISNWRIRFTGKPNDMSVEDFIYRVNALTRQSLNGDFNVLCRYVHMLFADNAEAWFWRHHRQTDRLNWEEICEGLRQKYKDQLSDYDRKENIRRRKQRANEPFDQFLDELLTMNDRLRIPMTDRELIETMIRNLKPDLRYELLHLDITDLSMLRRECHRHDHFMANFHNSIPIRNFPSRRNISEIAEEIPERVDPNITDSPVVAEISAENLKCWNCEVIGHRYQDCTNPVRRIFCYGCGKPDTYKPTCPKCNRGAENSNQDVRRSGYPNHLPRILFVNGITFPVENLYPKIEFPVSRGTSGISSLIHWDHSEDWFVTKYENMKTKSSGERLFKVNLSSDNEEFMSGHVIDGKILVPATSYLQYVWETFSLMYHGPSYMDVPVEFEDIRFLRATNMSMNGNIELNVMIHYGTGQFEITEAGSIVVTGRIREIENPTKPQTYEQNKKSDFPVLSQKDFYKELKLRGYHYNGAFRAVSVARGDGLYGRVEWKYNWVTFMDAMLQIQILGTDSRTLLIPTKIRKLRIYGLHHFDLITRMDPENLVFDVFVEPTYDRIISGGIELIGLHASPIQRRKAPGIPVLEKYKFLPYLPTFLLDETEATRTCVQLVLENTPLLKIKIVEVGTDHDMPIISKFVEALEDLPLVTGDFQLLTEKNIDEITGVHIERNKLTTHTNCHIVIANNLTSGQNDVTVKAAYKSLVEKGYLISKEKNAITSGNRKSLENFTLIANIQLAEGEQMMLYQKDLKKQTPAAMIIQVSETDTEFKWLAQIQSCLSNKNPIILYSFNESTNGLIGLVNCLRKEPDGTLITCFYIDDKNAPPFDLENSFYNRQLELNLAINVYSKGEWGSYRHLKLTHDIHPRPRSDHIYGNVMQRGDLSTLRWLEGPLDSENCSLRIAYSSLNFRDVMLATGRLAVELYGTSRLDLLCVLGLECSGINTITGRRVMTMVAKAGVASFNERPSKFIWDVPEHWTLQEAATVPVVYLTVYYAFFMTTDIRRGKSILIHAGTGGVGLAAIRVALAYKLEVFTTCSTPLKKKFLMQTFPGLKENHIGYSRDTSFEIMVQRETSGKGVDFVLNSLAEDKLMASVRCLGYGGHFLEIGKFDMSNDSKLGMSCFLKEITFHAVLADRLEFASDEDIQESLTNMNRPIL